MNELYINRDCIYYDWGDTAPREYGAFCKLKKCCIENANCAECKENVKMEQAKWYEIKTCILREDNVCVQKSSHCPAISFCFVNKIIYTDATYNKITKCSNYCVDAK